MIFRTRSAWSVFSNTIFRRRDAFLYARALVDDISKPCGTSEFTVHKRSHQFHQLGAVTRRYIGRIGQHSACGQVAVECHGVRSLILSLLLVVVHDHAVGHRVSLTTQHITFFDLVIFQRVIGEHLDLAFYDTAAAR